MAVESGIQRIAKFKLKAAERFNISPKKCHVGHVLIEAFLDRPLEIHQVTLHFFVYFKDSVYSPNYYH